MTLIVTGTLRAKYGQLEIVNKSIVPKLAKITETADKWDQILHKVEFAINNTIHKSTGQSPSMILFGVNQIEEVNDRIHGLLENEVSDSYVDIKEMRAKAAKCILKAQETNVAQDNANRKAPTLTKKKTIM